MLDPSHPAAQATGARPLPESIAAIDIGTNSIHMIIARPAAGGRHEVVTRHKETVRLGESGGDTIRELTPAAMDRGIAALERCRALVDSNDAPVAAVATSAVREAENRAEFIERARRDAGIDIEVIAGHEEARLIYLGVLQALPVYETPLVLCDIGGGSTEVLVGRRGEVRFARSLKLGAIRVTERFFPRGTTSAKRVAAARRHIRATLSATFHDMADLDYELAIGCSGTIESLFVMVLTADGDVPQSLNGATVTRAQLAECIETLIEARTSSARRKLPGIDVGRADILVGGALVLEAVMEGLDVDEWTFSDGALREGVLLQLSERLGHGSRHHLADIRQQSVEHLMQLCDDDPEHSWKVAELAVDLFDELGELVGLGVEDRSTLRTAALLANVGLFISHARHHQHSYYVIRNTEHLSGFTDREIEIIAQVARYHRRATPSDRHPPFAALTAAEQQRVTALAALLRVAVGLDRGHNGAVELASVSVGDEVIDLRVRAVSGADIALEVYSADERAGMLASLTGRSVRVRAKKAAK